MNFVEHAALEDGRTVAVFSLEMSGEQIVLRMLCSAARIDLSRVAKGFLDRGEMKRISDVTAHISQGRIFVDDTPGLSVMELQSRARRLHSEHHLDLLVIDYLQLMKSPSKRGQENRQIEVSEISQGIKALAKELRIPIVVLAQLNRNPDGRSDGKPKLSDLRESGSIEQDADVVGLLWRAAPYAEGDEKKTVGGKTELIIAKNRNGPVGEIPLTFLPAYTRFEPAAPEEAAKK